MIISKSEASISSGEENFLRRCTGFELPREKLAWMLQKMCETRYFEEKAEELYTRGLVHGTMHLSIGMEASPIGSIAAIEAEDLIIHHHRGHGHTIAKGADITVMFGEFLGKQPGYCHGRGGSMHIADIHSGNLGATGIVGGGIPIAVGIALTLKMRKTGKVLLSYFGDGSTNEGAFHEALNLAAIWNLPVVFICDNNRVRDVDGLPQVDENRIVSQRGPYPMASLVGLSMVTSVLDVYKSIHSAVQRARSGEGPTLVENVTYRWRGHSKSDRNLYRSQEEIEEWMQRCPIKKFKQLLVGSGIMTRTRSGSDRWKRPNCTIDHAAEGAVKMPEPSLATLEDEVYAE
jgi:acetoin:2,6-dichlorophenolindophenol oxidoreductase subunit alpha